MDTFKASIMDKDNNKTENTAATPGETAPEGRGRFILTGCSLSHLISAISLNIYVLLDARQNAANGIMPDVRISKLSILP